MPMQRINIISLRSADNCKNNSTTVFHATQQWPRWYRWTKRVTLHRDISRHCHTGHRKTLAPHPPALRVYNQTLSNRLICRLKVSTVHIEVLSCWVSVCGCPTVSLSLPLSLPPSLSCLYCGSDLLCHPLTCWVLLLTHRQTIQISMLLQVARKRCLEVTVQYSKNRR